MVATLTLCIIGGVILYTFFNPAEEQWIPKCIFRSLTGLQCPGCGSQRAIHAFLTGHPIEGIRYNFAWVVGIPTMLLCAVVEVFPTRFHRLRHTVYSRNFCLAVLAFIILWTLLRNIIGC